MSQDTVMAVTVSAGRTRKPGAGRKSKEEGSWQISVS